MDRNFLEIKISKEWNENYIIGLIYYIMVKDYRSNFDFDRYRDYKDIRDK